MNLTRWGTAVQEIRNAARIPEAALADAAGFTGPTLFRYLRGQRQPTSEAVQKIDAALADLLHQPNIASYLDAIYWLCAEDASTGIRMGAIDGFLDMLQLALTRLRPEAKAALKDQIDRMGSSRKKKLILAMNVMFRRALVRHIIGDADDAKSWFDQINDVFLKHGIDLAPWMKPRMEIEDDLAREQFTKAVRRALRIIDDPPLRFETESAIQKAFADYEAARLAAELRRLRGDKKGATK